MIKKHGQITFSILMVLSGIVGVTLSIHTQGWNLFKMYTEDSNLFNLITSIIYLVSLVGVLGEKPKNEYLIKVLRYVSTSCLAVTFFVVLFILAPMMGGIQGYKVMFFSGSMLYNHLITPLLAIISFIFFEKTPILNSKVIRWALLPTIIYAFITITLNIMGLLKGPYPFLMVRSQPVLMSIVWIVLIFSLNYLIAKILLYFNRKYSD